MIPWAFLVLPLLHQSVSAEPEKTRGVAPSLLAKYETAPASGQWSCLDGSKSIKWASVNDDYCDCADGSDEPGTGACRNNTFYCVNAGHIGSSIPSSRVDDGLCEPLCCDGSDEQPGVCPNRCKEVGEDYQKKQDALRKVRKTGAKIRSSYITFAQKEKKNLETQIAASTEEIKEREKEVARLKDIADRSESLSEAALLHRQSSPLYKSLLEHSTALKSLQREHAVHLERERQLGDILDALRSGYNPNYQDMAVLEAVRGWEALAGLPRLGEAAEPGSEEGSDDADAEEKRVEVEAAEVIPEDEWSKDELERRMDGLLRTDYVSLLFEHDRHIASPAAGSILFEVASYLPDSWAPQYESLRETLMGWLEWLGLVRAPIDASTDASRARQAFNDAEHSLSLARKELEKAQNDLKDLFDPEGFGAEGEWKKLDGTCLDLNTGEYTYEVCLFDEARQKPNHGGATHSLGHWAGWNDSPGVKPEDEAYYAKQTYRNGAKCWNGPQRSVNLVWTCGTENAITSVAELEKCEYQFTGTTPALCLPLDAPGPGAGHQEL